MGYLSHSFRWALSSIIHLSSRWQFFILSSLVVSLQYRSSFFQFRAHTYTVELVLLLLIRNLIEARHELGLGLAFWLVTLPEG